MSLEEIQVHVHAGLSAGIALFFVGKVAARPHLCLYVNVALSDSYQIFHCFMSFPLVSGMFFVQY